METSRGFLSLPYSDVFALVRQAIVEALLREKVKPLSIEEDLRPNISRGELLMD